jgi:hypothetical protein
MISNALKQWTAKITGTQITIFLGVLAAWVIFSPSGLRYNWAVQALFFAVCIVSLIGIFKSIEQFAFSLNKTFYLFFFFFFGLAPAVQFKFQNTFFNAPLMDSKTYVFGGTLILGILLAYKLLYAFFFKWASVKLTVKNRVNLTLPTLKIYYLVSFVACLVFLILIKGNWNIVFFRPPEGSLKLQTTGGFLGYALLLMVRPIPLIVLLHYWLTAAVKTKHIVALGLIALLTTFPSALSRGLIAAYYLPFLVLATPLGKAKFWYSLSYFFGIFLVFPVLNIFRSFNNHIFWGTEAFKTGHFDAFQNFMLLLNENLISGGKQLMGSLLFFVPQSVWPEKPLATGAWLAQELNFNYANIAMPYFGEGFANFGMVGIVLFLIVIAFVNAYADVSYHQKNRCAEFKIVYLFFLGFEFFLLRGDLTSAVNKTSGFVLALLLVYVTFKLSKIRLS